MTQVSSPIPKEALPKVWICPNCEKEITSNFCPWCGKKKPTEQRPPQREIACPGCGKIIDADAQFAFCPDCGTPFRIEPQPSVDKPIVIVVQEISDSWDEIIAAIYEGTVEQRYAIGAYKPLDLGVYGTVNMQLIAFNGDDRADGQGKAVSTWLAMEPLTETRRMNPEYYGGDEGTGMIGGWEKSELRQWLNDEVLPVIPDNIACRLVRVKKAQKSAISDEENTIQTTEDWIWIPSEEEVYGTQSPYRAFFLADEKSRIRRRQGMTGSVLKKLIFSQIRRTLGQHQITWWWLRSAGGSTRAIAVYSGGNNYYTNVNSAGGVVIGFCL